MKVKDDICPEFELGNIYFKPGNEFCYFWFPGDRWTPAYCKHLSHDMICPTNGLRKTREAVKPWADMSLDGLYHFVCGTQDVGGEGYNEIRKANKL